MESSLHGLEVSSKNVDCCGLVTLGGEMDLGTAPLVQSHIEALINYSAEHLVIDCGALKFIDSSGLHVLVNAHQAVKGNLGLVRRRQPIRRLFEIAGLSDEFPGFDSIEEAQDYLHHGGRSRLRAKA